MGIFVASFEILFCVHPKLFIVFLIQTLIRQ
jgi:hypothetical protein